MLQAYNYIRYYRKAGKNTFTTEESIEEVIPKEGYSLWEIFLELEKNGKISIPNDAYAFSCFTKPLTIKRNGHIYRGRPQNFSEIIYFGD